MSQIPFAPDAVRWQPLVAPADPRALACPQVPAQAAFWRRVRARFAADDPTFEERIAKRAAALAGLAAEIVDVLRQPLSVPMLQALHVQATRDQTAARALTADGGFKYVPFPYGKLKDKPNTLVQHGRITREFCPPDDVPRELQRLVADHDAIPASLPDVRAAWLVHALLGVHPFVDGNGRTARLLANRPFLEVDLPPIWGESSERGAGWVDTLAEAARVDGIGGIARLFAGHQERILLKLLGDAEAAPPDADLDGVLAHDARLRSARAGWADAVAATAASVPRLTALAVDRLAALGPRLDPEAVVVVSDADEWPRAALETCGDSAAAVDRRGAGGAVTLELPTRRASLRIALAHVGPSGSGALLGAGTVRPRATSAAYGAPILLVPEETEDGRAARFDAWCERALPEWVAAIVRTA